jgi:glycerol-3-phosphate cytidylyltransferase
MRIITFGTYDLFHIGHLKIIKRCKNMGDYLVVGISTDKFTYQKKHRYPIVNQNNRKEILESIKYIDEVFFEDSMEKKREYILKYKADILVMGDDWKGKFDEFNDICKVVYLPRTPSVSTTKLIEVIKDM